MSKTWSQYLREKCYALAVGPLNSHVKLLSVLIKDGGKLINVGPLSSIFTADDGVLDELQKFHRADVGQLEESNIRLGKGGGSVLLGLQELGAKLQAFFSRESSYTVKVLEPCSSGYEDWEIHQALEQGQLLLNLETNEKLLRWPKGRWLPPHGRDLWIVTELLTANEIVVTGGKKVTGGASGGGQLPQVPVFSANADVSISNAGDLRVTAKMDVAGKPIPFVFAVRAIRWHFNQSGEAEFPKDKITEADLRADTDAKNQILLDDLEYHLDELLSDGTGESAEDSLMVLDIQ